jgi:hypothetical protein
MLFFMLSNLNLLVPAVVAVCYVPEFLVIDSYCCFSVEREAYQATASLVIVAAALLVEPELAEKR